MARRKRAPEPGLPPATTYKSSTAIHYEIATDYGHLVCDYDPSGKLATDEQGNNVAAIIKAFRDRFDAYLDDYLRTSPMRPEFASWVEALAQSESIDNEQALHELRLVLLNLHTGAAWIEFTSGLGMAVSNAVSQWFEMSILAAKIQYGGLAPKIGNVAPDIMVLVKQQIRRHLKSPHLGGALTRLGFRYHLCLREWQEAKKIYRRNRNSTSWRKFINPQLPDDLIEWLTLSKKSDLGADAFLTLPDEARQRLDYRMKMEGYWLSAPSEIALEHAARLCGCPPYNRSTSQLKKIKSQQSKETERSGVRQHLKNTQSRRSREFDKAENEN